LAPGILLLLILLNRIYVYRKNYRDIGYHDIRQGDQIGRIFAYWAIVIFVLFGEKYLCSPYL
jgi:hypothetical protein